LGKLKLLAVLAVVIAITVLLKSYGRDKAARNAGREFLNRTLKASIIGVAVVITLALAIYVLKSWSYDRHSGSIIGSESVASANQSSGIGAI
jgi:hypothetical protein